MKNHIDSINALIPKADAEARRKVLRTGRVNEKRVGVDGISCSWDFFTEYFHEAMNRMTAQEGLRHVV
jgi:hypothetical protein